MPLTSRADIINLSVPSITDLTVEDVWVKSTLPPFLSDETHRLRRHNPPSLRFSIKNLLSSNESQATLNGSLGLSLGVRVTTMTGKTSGYLCDSKLSNRCAISVC